MHEFAEYPANFIIMAVKPHPITMSGIAIISLLVHLLYPLWRVRSRILWSLLFTVRKR